jgi:hypothetical protein
MTNPADFSQPVELSCVRDPDKMMARTIPTLAVLAFAIWLLTALPLGLMFPHTGAISLIGGIVAAAAVCTVVYVRKRADLRHTYGQLQRLVVHPAGLRRFDDSIVIDMPWTAIRGFQYRNSGLPPARNAIMSAGNPMAPAAAAALRRAHTVMAWGIVGHGTVAPLPGASKRTLKVHDRLGNSNLRGGQPHSSPNCLVFPEEFEENWSTGVVGAWLRHYRPDLSLPT